MIPALALLLTGCAPQDAEVTGNWHVWLAANNSATVDEGEIDVVERATRIYECSGRNWDSETDEWEEGYIGPQSGDDYAGGKYFGGACSPDDGDCPEAEMAADCDLIDAMEYFDFLGKDGFYYLTESIDTWRSEALINGEGDFQLTFHNKLGNGQDMRVMFVIKPDFAPSTCVDQDGDGTAEVVDIDGTTWVDAWSDGLGGDRLYYLNAGSAQSAPGELDEYGDPIIWYFPTEWSAGFGHAKFAAEEFTNQPNRYGLYDEVGVGKHFEISYAGGTAGASASYWGAAVDRSNPDMAVYAEKAAELVALADGWDGEINGVAMNGAAPVDGDSSAFTLMVEDNDWRPIDTHEEGLDGWMEVSSSWVKIKSGSTLEVGGSAEGEFQIFMEGLESSSAMVVRGSFVVDKIRKDKWAYPDLEDEKREENGEPYCGQATGAEE